MALTVRETIVRGVLAELQAISSIAGLQVTRNDDRVELPSLILWDVESPQRVMERAQGVNVYALDLVIEGAVSATSRDDVGTDLNALYGAAATAAKAAESSVAEIFEVLEGEFDPAFVEDDDGDAEIGPHAFFQLIVEIRFEAVPGAPETAA